MSESSEISAASIAPVAMPAPTSPPPTPAAVSGGVIQPPEPASPHAAPPETASPAAGTADSKGTPFDPEKHLPRLHPRTGRWMPRGGRKAGVTTPPAQPPDAPPPPSYIPPEDPAPASAAAENKASEPPPPPTADHSDDAGEVVCSSIEVIAGIILDAPEDCTPPAVEHKNMARAVAAYIRAKGWQATAGVGLLLMFGAYLLRVLRKPKPNAAVRRWVGLDRADKARDVTPDAERPTDPISPATRHTGAEIIDLPRSVPPLAR